MCGCQPRFIPPSGTVSKTLSFPINADGDRKVPVETLTEQGGRMGVLSCKAAP